MTHDKTYSFIHPFFFILILILILILINSIYLLVQLSTHIFRDNHTHYTHYTHYTYYTHYTHYRDYQRVLAPMLEDGIRVLIYAGDVDFICNW